MATPLISFIVSAFDRPLTLRGCLASLFVQQGGPYQIFVTDNSKEGCNWHSEYAQLGVRYFPTMEKTCYSAANCIGHETDAEWLCFPSDDSYYVPSFARLMLAKSADADLVYCDWLDTRLQPRYERFVAAPKTGAIDKTAFIVRREIFLRLGGFTDPLHEFADGHFVDSVVRSGARIAKAGGILLVHS